MHFPATSVSRLNCGGHSARELNTSTGLRACVAWMWRLWMADRRHPKFVTIPLQVHMHHGGLSLARLCLRGKYTSSNAKYFCSVAWQKCFCWQKVMPTGGDFLGNGELGRSRLRRPETDKKRFEWSNKRFFLEKLVSGDGKR